jgi:hypothetical protein
MRRRKIKKSDQKMRKRIGVGFNGEEILNVRTNVFEKKSQRLMKGGKMKSGRERRGNRLEESGETTKTFGFVLGSGENVELDIEKISKLGNVVHWRGFKKFGEIVKEQ